MREQSVSFHCRGARLAGLWRGPADAPDPVPAVVHGPGWMGLKDASHYRPVHAALVERGIGAFVFDYRGFGGSEGDPTAFSPIEQMRDLTAATSYLETRDDVDADRLGVYGLGATGGGHAVVLAGTDDRIRAAVAHNPIADGGRWLRGMRPEHAWATFLDRLAEDRRRRARDGEGELVDPQADVLIPIPERAAIGFKSDVDHAIPHRIRLDGVDELLAYRPVDHVGRRRFALMVVGVEGDTNTPFEHCAALFDAATGPRKLVRQRHTTHYAALRDYEHVVPGMIAEWFAEHLVAADIETTTGGAA